MSKLSQHYSKNEPKAKIVERVIEETDSVQKVAVAPEAAAPEAEAAAPERFVIKVGDNKWLKSWMPVFALCDKKSDAEVLNTDWARGHRDRVVHFKHMKAEIVKL